MDAIHALGEYVHKNAVRGACTCGLCCDAPDTSVDDGAALHGTSIGIRAHIAHVVKPPLRQTIKADRRADDLLWKAICQVESGGDPNAYNEREGAAGIAQIRPILVRDVCRIVGYGQFSLRDRFDHNRSKEMFRIYIRHYGQIGSVEESSRIWCSGPRGMSKAASLPYWRKVQSAMKEIETKNDRAD